MSKTNTAIIVPEELEQSSSSRPNVFEYLDYREFIKDWLEFLKTTKNISLRKFAKYAMISPSFLAMMLSGQRPLSAKASAKILPHLHLEEHESRYFEKLRLSEVAPNAESQHAAILELRNHKNFKLNNQKEAETFNYLSHWYHIAIRELAADEKFNEDPKWIQNKLSFHVSLGKIRDALKFLIDKDFLVRDENGKVRSLDKKIYCTKKIYKHSLRSFHENMLELALQSIDKIDASERMVIGNTVYVDDDHIQEIREVLKEAREKISAIELDYNANSKKKGKVYHIELAGFPLTDAKLKKK